MGARLDRMGQLHQVTIFKFFSEQSVEVHIRKLQQNKRENVSVVLDDELIVKHSHTLANADDEQLVHIVSICPPSRD